jgi:hypothetical protein
MSSILQFIKGRLGETSTWIGIITFIGGSIMYFTPDNIDVYIRDLQIATIGMINIVAGLIGAVKKDKGND